MTTDGRHLLTSGKFPMLAPDLATEILATISDITLMITPQMRVAAVLVNAGHRSFGQLTDWEGLPLADILTDESRRKLEMRLTELDQGRTVQGVELNHVSQNIWEFPVRYSLHRLGPDGSLLMLGRDLRPLAEVQQQLVAAQLALERDYEAQRELDTRYRVLMETVRDPVMLVSMSSGRIADLNPAAAQLLGGARSEMVGAAVAQEFDGRRRGEFLEALANVATAEVPTPVEVTTRRSQRRVLVTPRLFRAAGERLLLCLIDSVERTARPLDDLADNLSRLYHEGADGIVFADADGVIRAANRRQRHRCGAGPVDRRLSGARPDRPAGASGQRQAHGAVAAVRHAVDDRLFWPDRGGIVRKLAERPSRSGAGHGGARCQPR